MDKTKVAVIGIPFDKYSSFMKGTASAPPLIRQALHSDSSNLWSEAGIDLGDENFIIDRGDLQLNRSDSPLQDIENAVAELLEQNFTPISLGGDHSITYPILKAISKKYDKLSILQFDAHPDLYDEFEGNRFSHACPFARIMEEKLVQRLVQVGIRSVNDHQRSQMEKFGVETIFMKDFNENLKLEFDSPLYITFDMDALDPAFAPGISHHEPGGLTTRQAIRLIQNVKAPLIVGADIVEFNPVRDFNGITAMTAAKILKEMVGVMVSC